MIPQTVQDLIARFPLGFVATVTSGGRPSVSPKGTFLVLDDNTIAFGEVRSPGTMANLAHRAEAERIEAIVDRVLGWLNLCEKPKEGKGWWNHLAVSFEVKSSMHN